MRIGFLVVGANKDHARCGGATLGQAFQRGPIAQLVRFRGRLTMLTAQGVTIIVAASAASLRLGKLGSRAFASRVTSSRIGAPIGVAPLSLSAVR